MEEEIIRLRQEILALKKAGDGLYFLISAAQVIVQKHSPKPNSDRVAFEDLLNLLESPRQRKVQEQWRQANG